MRCTVRLHLLVMDPGLRELVASAPASHRGDVSGGGRTCWALEAFRQSKAIQQEQ